MVAPTDVRSGLPGFGSTDLEIEVGNTVRGAVDAEDLADHAELKNR